MAIESNGYDDLPGSHELDRKEVIDLQALAMGVVRPLVMQNGHSMLVRDDPRRHGFCILDDSGGEIGSGETDVFLSVQVRKPEPRKWGMAISFLGLELTEERRSDNDRRLFQFRWDDETARGRRIERQAIGKPSAANVEIEGMAVFPDTDTVVRQRIHPLLSEDLQELRGTILSFVEKAL